MAARQAAAKGKPGQALHLVFGGELADLGSAEFRDPATFDIVGIFPTYAAARAAWKGAAQRTVDNALMRYFVVDLDPLLTPDGTPLGRGTAR